MIERINCKIHIWSISHSSPNYFCCHFQQYVTFSNKWWSEWQIHEFWNHATKSSSSILRPSFNSFAEINCTWISSIQPTFHSLIDENHLIFCFVFACDYPSNALITFANAFLHPFAALSRTPDLYAYWPIFVAVSTIDIARKGIRWSKGNKKRLRGGMARMASLGVIVLPAGNGNWPAAKLTLSICRARSHYFNFSSGKGEIFRPRLHNATIRS